MCLPLQKCDILQICLGRHTIGKVYTCPNAEDFKPFLTKLYNSHAKKIITNIIYTTDDIIYHYLRLSSLMTVPLKLKTLHLRTMSKSLRRMLVRLRSSGLR